MSKWIWVGLLVCVSCFAAPEHVERHAAQLRKVLQQADEAYYNTSEPIMGNAAYDALRRQYETLVSTYPDLSDLSQVGADLPDGALRVKHTKPVLSLKKAYADAEVTAFLDKCGADLAYCVEPKLDGLTIVLRYRNGLLVQALTRGDGQSGMDVTAAMVAAGCVPVSLKDAPRILELRGEVLMSFAAFNVLNDQRRLDGLEPLKNPRNTAAGTLRLKDYAEITRRGLTVRIFEIIETDSPPASHSESLAMVSALGLPIVDCRVVPGAEVLPAIEKMNRAGLDDAFPTDGIVIRLNDRAAFEQLGATAKYPRGALARKYRAASVESTLLRVEWTRGETGRLTPVAHFEPVEQGGAILQRASLHSLDHLRALDLMIGDRIQVVRAGGSVPEIIGRSSAPRTGRETAIPVPEK
jgi:DNA ligase (NAD+)